MQIHFFAAARAASGVAETQVSLTDLAEPTLHALVEKLGEAFTGKTASGMTPRAGYAPVLVPDRRYPLRTRYRAHR